MIKTKILIADDHRIVSEGIKNILSKYQEFEVVGTALNGQEAIKLSESLKPDIMIMDIVMPGIDGIDATKKINKSSIKTKIVVYTMHSEKQYVIDLFRAGISAYVLKQDPTSDLILALQAVKGGGTYFSTLAPTVLMRHMEKLEKSQKVKDSFTKLSLREHEVFCLLADGKPIKKIAEQLYISPKTVETHKYNIMQKLDVRTIAELTKIGIKKNLIKL